MNLASLPKLTVILGAGASWDVANDGTQKDDPWRPPLASELFAIQKRAVFEPLLTKFPGAQNLVCDLAPKGVHQKDFNLERELRILADHPDVRVRQQFQEIPAYIRAVIVECCKRYVKGPGCFAQLSKSVLADVQHRVLFLTLNYDTYIERALVHWGVGPFENIEDYTDRRRQALLVKAHGSIDWFREYPIADGGPLPRLQAVDLTRIIPSVRVLGGMRTEAFEPSGGVASGRGLYPVLTAPLAGKDSSHLVCPDEHLQAAAEFLQDCKKYLVIGTSGRDDDLLQFLDAHMPPACGQVAHFVDPVDVHAVAQRFRDGVRAFRSARIEKHGRGFAGHMLNPTFIEFLKDSIP